MGEHCRVELDHVNTISFFPRPRLTFWTQLDRRHPALEEGHQTAFPPPQHLHLHASPGGVAQGAPTTHTHTPTVYRETSTTSYSTPPWPPLHESILKQGLPCRPLRQGDSDHPAIADIHLPPPPRPTRNNHISFIMYIHIYTHIYTHITIIPILVSDSAISMNLNNHLTFFLNQFRVLCCRNYPCV